MSNSSASNKFRLDKKLTGISPQLSRTKAQQLITSGQVKVNGVVITDVAFSVTEEMHIELLSHPKFVSRGGEKLEGALATFNITVQDKTCLDVGASTGGFTDCLLQNGAKKVYTIDVGTNQLAQQIKADPRVISYEQTHINQLSRIPFETTPQLVVIDVSFISLKKTLPFIYETFQTVPLEIIALVKPQFEFADYCTHKNLDKLSDKEIKAIIDKLEADINQLHTDYTVQNTCLCPITGTDGTQEYFFYIK